MVGKLRYCLLVLALSIVPEIWSQDIFSKSVEIKYESGKIEKYLSNLSNQVGSSFSYSNSINPQGQIFIKSGTYTLKQALDSIFYDQNVYYIARRGIIILSPQPLRSGNNNRIMISGRVTSGRSDKPVSFASVFFKEKSVGTITNVNGEFQLNIYKEYFSDTLSITSIGFKPVNIAPEQYLTGEVKVRLSQQNIHLDELFVRPDKVEDIVLDAYLKRYRNYPIQPSYLTAFFRELNTQDEKVMSVSEALIDINKAGYMNEKNDLVKIVKGRKGEDEDIPKVLNFIVQGGLYNHLRLDIAKYTSPFFSSEALLGYNFKIDKKIFYRDRQTYVIAFDVKEEVQDIGYRGVMYIDMETLALVRAEFEISPEMLRYAKKLLIKKSPRGYKIKPDYGKYVVDYRHYNHRWNLSHARSEVGIKVKKRRSSEGEKSSCDFITTSEFVVTEQNNTEGERIKWRESAKSSDVLINQIEDTPMGYWGDENVIIPEEPIVETIKKLQAEGMLKVDEKLFQVNAE